MIVSENSLLKGVVMFILMIILINRIFYFIFQTFASLVMKAYTMHIFELQYFFILIKYFNKNIDKRSNFS